MKRWRRPAGVVVLAMVAAGCGAPNLPATGTTSVPAGAPTSTATSPAPATAASGPVAVVLFGDSLAAQAAPDFDRIIAAGGGSPTNHVFGGTAVCDWLPTMRSVASTHPRAVVLEFTGNTFTGCMSGCQAGSPSAATKYCVDMESAVEVFARAGSKVFLAATPIDYAQAVAGDAHWDDLNRAFATLAAAHPGTVTYVDAGVAVEGPDGSFAWTLPCLASEPCTGAAVGGTASNVVRVPDGVHFCPPVKVIGCAGYSSGAYRYASAMATPVLRALHLTTPVPRGAVP